MAKDLFIENYVHIRNNCVYLNGKLFFQAADMDLNSFLKKLYKYLDIGYSKFFKMDSLSKLSFLAAELALKDCEFDVSNTGLVMSNSASSLDSDRKHQESIEDPENYFPSPAVFVYTLPNIGIGEISIRHKIKSENAFFIFEKYNAGFHFNYEKSLIDAKKCDSILGGWLNTDDTNYEAFLYLISESGKIAYSKENLLELNKN